MIEEYVPGKVTIEAIEEYVPGKIAGNENEEYILDAVNTDQVDSQGFKTVATKQKVKPKILRSVRVSIPLDRIREQKRKIKATKKSLATIEKRINDIDIE